MYLAKLRELVKKLGLVRTTAYLALIAALISVGVTLAMMAATDSFSVHGIVLAIAAPVVMSAVTTIVFLRMFFDLDTAEAALKKIAITDELTGVYNRRYFLDVAEREIARALRFGKPFSTILLDIDGFKKINDSYGHVAGDAVLAAVASTCLRHCRRIDTFARYGGDEFYFLLPECTQEEAQTFAERIRAAIEQFRIQYDGLAIPVTVSLGVQMFGGSEDSLDRLLIRTDNAMYSAKQAGRNRISVEPVLNK